MGALVKCFPISLNIFPRQYPRQELKGESVLPDYDQLDDESKALIVSLLPAVATEIAEVIGFGPALDLFNAFGGTEAYLYKSVPPLGCVRAIRFAELGAVIGEENVLRLGNTYNSEGGHIYIPRCQAAMNALKTRQIVAEFDELLKTRTVRDAANKLARRFRLSNRQIEKIVNGRKQCKPKGATP